MIFPKSPLGVARPAWKFVGILLFLAIGTAFLLPALAAIPAILAIYVCWFFRDPRRAIAGRATSLCSPCDGKVVSVIEVPCPEMPGGRARRVAVFLNIFNVHIQRAVLAGKVTAVKRRRGRFISATDEKCSEENEAVTMWLDCSGTAIGLRQIAGAIAQRIVCYARVGDELDKGERYGLIQFGSRVEIFMPLDYVVKVKPGQRVSGGSTLLAVPPDA